MGEYGETISKDVAKALLDMAAYIYTATYYNNTGAEPAAEVVTEYARGWFESFCECEGIEEIEAV